MNLTIAVDDALLARARLAAQQRGTSLQALLREYLRQLAGELTAQELAEELDRLHREQPGHSGGRRIRREDAYEERP